MLITQGHVQVTVRRGCVQVYAQLVIPARAALCLVTAPQGQV